MGRFTNTGLRTLNLLLLCAACSSTTTKEDDKHDGNGGTSTGGANTGGSNTDTGGSGAVTGDDTLCTSYCDTLAAACAGEFQQFVTPDTCLEYCKLLPPGNEGDEIGNSVHCRLNQAAAAGAVGEPDQHCAEAGPGGNGVCGSNCEAYCLVLERACSASFANAFDSAADCFAQCSEIPDIGPFNSTINSGNSIQCRLWHVSAASVETSPHCVHSIGEPPCAE